MCGMGMDSSKDKTVRYSTGKVDIQIDEKLDSSTRKMGVAGFAWTGMDSQYRKGG